MWQLTLYGAADCDDTAQTRALLHERQIVFHEHAIDHDPVAEQFVVFINGGYRSTPTLVFTAGRFKLVLTEPTEDELMLALQIANRLPSPVTERGGGHNDSDSDSRL
jgi:mycoredoxin